MKIGICARNLEGFTLPKDLSYIGVDQGVEELLKQNIQPILAIGDFDSLENQDNLKSLKIKVLPTRKDVTDTHAAVEYALEQGYNEIELYGVTGGRLDHFLAVLCLLKYYPDYKISIIDRQNIITLLKAGKHQLKKDNYKYISFFAIKDTYLSLKGFQYDLDYYLLKNNDPLCVSNEIKAKIAWIENSQNLFLVKANDKK